MTFSSVFCAVVWVALGPLVFGCSAKPAAAPPELSQVWSAQLAPKAALSVPSVEVARVAVARPWQSAPLEFLSDEAEGVAIARRERRPMILVFFAKWSGVCNQLEQQTFSDPEFRDRAAGFVGVRVDMTEEESPTAVAAASKYHVRGLPTALILDSMGNEAARIEQFVGPETMIAMIAKVQ